MALKRKQGDRLLGLDSLLEVKRLERRAGGNEHGRSPPRPRQVGFDCGESGGMVVIDGCGESDGMVVDSSEEEESGLF